MKLTKKQIQAIKRLDYVYDAFEGEMTPQQFLQLVDLGMKLSNNHEKSVKTAEYQKSIGDSQPRYYLFAQPKKHIIEAIDSIIYFSEY